MSYINKKDRVFSTRRQDVIHPARSEARMKNYISAFDLRAWCDIVEERRQHILEIQARNREGHCKDKLIPFEVMFDAILKKKKCQIIKLNKKIQYNKKILKIFDQLDLSPEEKEKLQKAAKEIPSDESLKRKHAKRISAEGRISSDDEQKSTPKRKKLSQDQKDKPGEDRAMEKRKASPSKRTTGEETAPDASSADAQKQQKRRKKRPSKVFSESEGEPDGVRKKKVKGEVDTVPDKHKGLPEEKTHSAANVKQAKESPTRVKQKPDTVKEAGGDKGRDKVVPMKKVRVSEAAESVKSEPYRARRKKETSPSLTGKSDTAKHADAEKSPTGRGKESERHESTKPKPTVAYTDKPTSVKDKPSRETVPPKRLPKSKQEEPMKSEPITARSKKESPTVLERKPDKTKDAEADKAPVRRGRVPTSKQNESVEPKVSAARTKAAPQKNTDKVKYTDAGDGQPERAATPTEKPTSVKEKPYKETDVDNNRPIERVSPKKLPKSKQEELIKSEPIAAPSKKETPTVLREKPDQTKDSEADKTPVKRGRVPTSKQDESVEPKVTAARTKKEPPKKTDKVKYTDAGDDQTERAPSPTEKPTSEKGKPYRKTDADADNRPIERVPPKKLPKSKQEELIKSEPTAARSKKASPTVLGEKPDQTTDAEADKTPVRRRLVTPPKQNESVEPKVSAARTKNEPPKKTDKVKYTDAGDDQTERAPSPTGKPTSEKENPHTETDANADNKPIERVLTKKLPKSKQEGLIKSEPTPARSKKESPTVLEEKPDQTKHAEADKTPVKRGLVPTSKQDELVEPKVSAARTKEEPPKKTDKIKSTDAGDGQAERAPTEKEQSTKEKSSPLPGQERKIPRRPKSEEARARSAATEKSPSEKKVKPQESSSGVPKSKQPSARRERPQSAPPQKKGLEAETFEEKSGEPQEKQLTAATSKEHTKKPYIKPEGALEAAHQEKDKKPSQKRPDTTKSLSEKKQGPADLAKGTQDTAAVTPDSKVPLKKEQKAKTGLTNKKSPIEQPSVSEESVYLSMDEFEHPEKAVAPDVKSRQNETDAKPTDKELKKPPLNIAPGKDEIAIVQRPADKKPSEKPETKKAMTERESNIQKKREPYGKESKTGTGKDLDVTNKALGEPYPKITKEKEKPTSQEPETKKERTAKKTKPDESPVRKEKMDIDGETEVPRKDGKPAKETPSKIPVSKEKDIMKQKDLEKPTKEATTEEEDSEEFMSLQEKSDDVTKPKQYPEGTQLPKKIQDDSRKAKPVKGKEEKQTTLPKEGDIIKQENIREPKTPDDKGSERYPKETTIKKQKEPTSKEKQPKAKKELDTLSSPEGIPDDVTRPDEYKKKAENDKLTKPVPKEETPLKSKSPKGIKDQPTAEKADEKVRIEEYPKESTVKKEKGPTSKEKQPKTKKELDTLSSPEGIPDDVAPPDDYKIKEEDDKLKKKPVVKEETSLKSKSPKGIKPEEVKVEDDLAGKPVKKDVPRDDKGGKILERKEGDTNIQKGAPLKEEEDQNKKKPLEREKIADITPTKDDSKKRTRPASTKEDAKKQDYLDTKEEKQKPGETDDRKLSPLTAEETKPKKELIISIPPEESTPSKHQETPDDDHERKKPISEVELKKPKDQVPSKNASITSSDKYAKDAKLKKERPDDRKIVPVEKEFKKVKDPEKVPRSEDLAPPQEDAEASKPIKKSVDIAKKQKIIPLKEDIETQKSLEYPRDTKIKEEKPDDEKEEGKSPDEQKNEEIKVPEKTDFLKHVSLPSVKELKKAIQPKRYSKDIKIEETKPDDTEQRKSPSSVKEDEQKNLLEKSEEEKRTKKYPKEEQKKPDDGGEIVKQEDLEQPKPLTEKKDEKKKLFEKTDSKHLKPLDGKKPEEYTKIDDESIHVPSPVEKLEEIGKAKPDSSKAKVERAEPIVTKEQLLEKGEEFPEEQKSKASKEKLGKAPSVLETESKREPSPTLKKSSEIAASIDKPSEEERPAEVQSKGDEIVIKDSKLSALKKLKDKIKRKVSRHKEISPIEGTDSESTDDIVKSKGIAPDKKIVETKHKDDLESEVAGAEEKPMEEKPEEEFYDIPFEDKTSEDRPPRIRASSLREDVFFDDIRAEQEKLDRISKPVLLLEDEELEVQPPIEITIPTSLLPLPELPEDKDQLEDLEEIPLPSLDLLQDFMKDKDDSKTKRDEDKDRQIEPDMKKQMVLEKGEEKPDLTASEIERALKDKMPKEFKMDKKTEPLRDFSKFPRDTDEELLVKDKVSTDIIPTKQVSFGSLKKEEQQQQIKTTKDKILSDLPRFSAELVSDMPQSATEPLKKDTLKPPCQAKCSMKARTTGKETKPIISDFHKPTIYVDAEKMYKKDVPELYPKGHEESSEGIRMSREKILSDLFPSKLYPPRESSTTGYPKPDLSRAEFSKYKDMPISSPIYPPKIDNTYDKLQKNKEEVLPHRTATMDKVVVDTVEKTETPPLASERSFADEKKEESSYKPPIKTCRATCSKKPHPVKINKADMVKKLSTPTILEDPTSYGKSTPRIFHESRIPLANNRLTGSELYADEIEPTKKLVETKYKDDLESEVVGAEEEPMEERPLEEFYDIPIENRTSGDNPPEMRASSLREEVFLDNVRTDREKIDRISAPVLLPEDEELDLPPPIELTIPTSLLTLPELPEDKDQLEDLGKIPLPSLDLSEDFIKDKDDSKSIRDGDKHRQIEPDMIKQMVLVKGEENLDLTASEIEVLKDKMPEEFKMDKKTEPVRDFSEQQQLRTSNDKILSDLPRIPTELLRNMPQSAIETLKKDTLKHPCQAKCSMKARSPQKENNPLIMTDFPKPTIYVDPEKMYKKDLPELYPKGPEESSEGIRISREKILSDLFPSKLYPPRESTAAGYPKPDPSKAEYSKYKDMPISSSRYPSKIDNTYDKLQKYKEEDKVVVDTVEKTETPPMASERSLAISHENKEESLYKTLPTKQNTQESILEKDQEIQTSYKHPIKTCRATCSKTPHPVKVNKAGMVKKLSSPTILGGPISTDKSTPRIFQGSPIPLVNNTNADEEPMEERPEEEFYDIPFENGTSEDSPPRMRASSLREDVLLEDVRAEREKNDRISESVLLLEDGELVLPPPIELTIPTPLLTLPGVPEDKDQLQDLGKIPLPTLDLAEDFMEDKDDSKTIRDEDKRNQIEPEISQQMVLEKGGEKSDLTPPEIERALKDNILQEFKMDKKTEPQQDFSGFPQDTDEEILVKDKVSTDRIPTKVSFESLKKEEKEQQQTKTTKDKILPALPRSPAELVSDMPQSTIETIQKDTRKPPCQAECSMKARTPQKETNPLIMTDLPKPTIYVDTEKLDKKNVPELYPKGHKDEALPHRTTTKDQVIVDAVEKTETPPLASERSFAISHEKKEESLYLTLPMKQNTQQSILEKDQELQTSYKHPIKTCRATCSKTPHPVKVNKANMVKKLSSPTILKDPISYDKGTPRIFQESPIPLVNNRLSGPKLYADEIVRKLSEREIIPYFIRPAVEPDSSQTETDSSRKSSIKINNATFAKSGTDSEIQVYPEEIKNDNQNPPIKSSSQEYQVHSNEMENVNQLIASTETTHQNRANNMEIQLDGNKEPELSPRRTLEKPRQSATISKESLKKLCQGPCARTHKDSFKKLLTPDDEYMKGKFTNELGPCGRCLNCKPLFKRKHKEANSCTASCAHSKKKDFKTETKAKGTKESVEKSKTSKAIGPKIAAKGFETNTENLELPQDLDNTSDDQRHKNKSQNETPKVLLLWERNGSRSSKATSETKVKQELIIGNRLSRVLSGDATALSSTQNISFALLREQGSKTLSAEIFSKRFSKLRQSSKFMKVQISNIENTLHVNKNRFIRNQFTEISDLPMLKNQTDIGVLTVSSFNICRKTTPINVSISSGQFEASFSVQHLTGSAEELDVFDSKENVHLQVRTVIRHQTCQLKQISTHVQTINSVLGVNYDKKSIGQISLIVSRSVQLTPPQHYLVNKFTPRSVFLEQFSKSVTEITLELIKRQSIITNQNYFVENVDAIRFPRTVSNLPINTEEVRPSDSFEQICSTGRDYWLSEPIKLLPDSLGKPSETHVTISKHIFIDTLYEKTTYERSRIQTGLDESSTKVKRRNHKTHKTTNKKSIVLTPRNEEKEYECYLNNFYEITNDFGFNTRSASNFKDEDEFVYAKDYDNIRTTASDNLDYNVRTNRYFNNTRFSTSRNEKSTKTIHLIDSKAIMAKILLENQKLSDEKTSPISYTQSMQTLIVHKDAEIFALRKALQAKSSFAAEQQKVAAAAIEKLENIKNTVYERDELRQVLKKSQFQLNELKKQFLVSTSDQQSETSKTELQVNCEPPLKQHDQHYDASAKESRKTLPTQTLNVRNKRIQTYFVHNTFKAVTELCYDPEHWNINLWKTKLFDENEILKISLGEIRAERTFYKNEIAKLQKDVCTSKMEAKQAEKLKRTFLLSNEALRETHLLCEKTKRGRLLELEKTLKYLIKEKLFKEQELKYMRTKLSSTEIELMKQKNVVYNLQAKVSSIQEELTKLKNLQNEKEELYLENINLRNRLEEFNSLQENCEKLRNQMKRLEIFQKERDIYKSKCESFNEIESECDFLRLKVEKGTKVEYEKNLLEIQVDELQACITEQDGEIHRLVSHIDHLMEHTYKQ